MKIDIGRKYDSRTRFIFEDRNINKMADILIFSLIRNIYQISEKMTLFPQQSILHVLLKLYIFLILSETKTRGLLTWQQTIF